MRLVCNYERFLGPVRVDEISTWLTENVGEEDTTWIWGGRRITIKEIDPLVATVFKLKFGL